MREHMGLYRGKRKDNGKWAEGYLYEHEPPLQGVVPKGYTPPPSRWFIVKTAFADWNMPRQVEFIEVDPDTVGECTGLPDKNGKLIFEGDICDHHVQGDILVNRGVVNWDAKHGRWAFQLNTMNPCFYMHNPDAGEKIGNIHDNPELLESEGQA